MPKTRDRKSIEDWGESKVRPGESKELRVAVSESYSGLNVKIPLFVSRSKQPGPVVFVTAALHGDEINGTGAIRQIIQDETLQLLRGAVILVPVLNILAFDRHSRYLPDRRDLNRAFPGSSTGSLAGRMARRLFDEIVLRSDYGIDLHTAAVHRTNYPNVRGDLSDPQVRYIAEAFGCEIMIHGKGPKGCFRREACAAGCPTIVMEAGEVCKVEPGIVQTAVRGIRNTLSRLEMLDAEMESPDYQVEIQESKWIRAEQGGFLQFHISPGDIIEKRQPLATNTTLLGRERNTLVSPFNAVVIGMTTLPAVSPGEPICHLGKLPKGTQPSKFRKSRSDEDGLEERVSGELASNVLVIDPQTADEKQ